MRFYGMSYLELMAIPIKTFWLMNENIGRIQATEDLRQMEVSINAQSQEGFTTHRDRLLKETGDVFKGNFVPYDTTRDEAGFEELRMMM